jgi:Ran GTPase-activating protein (RanGAP) involved in mRNA processing and transport
LLFIVLLTVICGLSISPIISFSCACVFFFQANKIGHDGMQALARMLANNRNLYFLNLTEAIEPAESNGHDTQKSVRMLADALEMNNTTIIKLETNPIYDPKLERLLSRNMQTHRASQRLKAKLRNMRR